MQDFLPANLRCAFAGQELVALQSRAEDAECLPTLSVNDIERKAESDTFTIQHKGRSLTSFSCHQLLADIVACTVNCRAFLANHSLFRFPYFSFSPLALFLGFYFCLPVDSCNARAFSL